MSTAAIIMGAITAASTAMKGYSQYQQGKATAKGYREQAKRIADNESQLRLEGSINEDRTREQNRQAISGMRAMWGLLLKHNPVSRVTIFSFSTPIFGTVLSTLLLDEASNTGIVNLIITLILVSLGIFLLNYMPKSKALPELPKPTAQSGEACTKNNE